MYRVVRHPFFRVMLCAMLAGCATVSDTQFELPALADIEHIYLLGSFDIPDLPPDRDGIRDRPRYVIWPAQKSSTPAHDVTVDLAHARERILAMLSNNYKTVDSKHWHSHYSRTGEGLDGGLVLHDGTVIGWHHDNSGLAYFDFGYDENTEKAGWIEFGLARNDKKTSTDDRRLYRVPRCCR